MKDRHPYHAVGTLRKSDGNWMIELDSDGPTLRPGTGDNATGHLADGTPVRLLYWTNDPTGAPTEYEVIAEIQQLDLAVVAHGLEAEGSLANERQEFLQRLSLIEQ